MRLSYGFIPIRGYVLFLRLQWSHYLSPPRWRVWRPGRRRSHVGGTATAILNYYQLGWFPLLLILHVVLVDQVTWDYSSTLGPSLLLLVHHARRHPFIWQRFTQQDGLMYFSEIYFIRKWHAHCIFTSRNSTTAIGQRSTLSFEMDSLGSLELLDAVNTAPLILSMPRCTH